jgi:hypothetical protein
MIHKHIILIDGNLICGYNPYLLWSLGHCSGTRWLHSFVKIDNFVALMSQVKHWHPSAFDAMTSIPSRVCDVNVIILGDTNDTTKKSAITKGNRDASAAWDRSRLLRIKLF